MKADASAALPRIHFECALCVYQFVSATLTELGQDIFLPVNQGHTDKAQGRMTPASGSFESVSIYNPHAVELEIRSLLS